MSRPLGLKLLVGLLTVITQAACASGGGRSGPAPSATCSLQAPEEIRWVRPDTTRETDLERWCAAVGQPVSVGGDTPAPEWSTLVVVSWNMHGEAGDLEGFLRDLMQRHGQGAEALVVLLQEAPRRGGTVPGTAPLGSRWGKRLGSAEASDSTHDVVVQARRYGLHLAYVPSMRNGEAVEDRGNAILSNQPLSDLVAVELPFVRDRRVAVTASIPGPGGETLRVTSLHLDHLAGFRDFGRGFGSARTHQVSRLLEAIPYHRWGILAGDFNAWHGEEREPALRLARAVYPSVEEIPEAATVRALGGLLGRRHDFILARLPEGWSLEYQVLEETYGSDHRPLVGSVRRTPVP